MRKANIDRLMVVGMFVLCSALPKTALLSAWPRMNKPPAAQAEAQLMGTWKGDSICQVKSSPCHDEQAIYLLSKSTAAGKVTIDLGKIVEGKPESMTVLDFTYDPAKHTLICEQKYGVWELHIKGDKMEGTLTTPDRVIYRRMSLKKAE